MTHEKRAKNREYMRKWRAKNPQNREYQREYHRAWRENQDNLEASRARARAWYQANKDSEKLKTRLREAVARRRARLRDASVGTVDVDALLFSAGGKCQICGGDLGERFHLDHIIPLSKGGSHSQDNLQVTHPRCNHIKHARVDWRELEYK